MDKQLTDIKSTLFCKGAYCLFGLFGVLITLSDNSLAQSRAQTNNSRSEAVNTNPAKKISSLLYEVEMLVYKFNTQDNTEKFPILNNLHYPDQVDRFVQDDNQLSHKKPEDYGEYRLLEAQGSELNSVLSKVNKSNGYTVLFHKRWQQYIPERAQGRYLLIEGGASYGAYQQLQGVLFLYLGRYLHATLELWLSNFIKSGKSSQPLPPLPPRAEEKDEIQLFQTEIGAFRRKARNISDDLDAQNPKKSNKLPAAKSIVRLKEARRMRSKNLHHFDHPLMGALLHIQAVEEESQ